MKYVSPTCQLIVTSDNRLSTTIPVRVRASTNHILDTTTNTSVAEGEKFSGGPVALTPIKELGSVSCSANDYARLENLDGNNMYFYEKHDDDEDYDNDDSDNIEDDGKMLVDLGQPLQLSLPLKGKSVPYSSFLTTTTTTTATTTTTTVTAKKTATANTTTTTKTTTTTTTTATATVIATATTNSIPLAPPLKLISSKACPPPAPPLISTQLVQPLATTLLKNESKITPQSSSKTITKPASSMTFLEELRAKKLKKTKVNNDSKVSSPSPSQSVTSSIVQNQGALIQTFMQIAAKRRIAMFGDDEDSSESDSDFDSDDEFYSDIFLRGVAHQNEEEKKIDDEENNGHAKKNVEVGDGKQEASGTVISEEEEQQTKTIVGNTEKLCEKGIIQEFRVDVNVYPSVSPQA